MSKVSMAAATFACLVVLSSCQRHAEPKPAMGGPAVIDAQWTRIAAERAERLTEAALKQDPRRGGANYALPQLRVYDAAGQLVYLLDPTRGWSPETIGGVIDQAIASRQAVTGPPLEETLGDLQAADGRPASVVVAPRGTPLVFDYWASWCVPCRLLEKSLLQWQGSKPRGAVQIVRAEADPMKLARERGEKVFMVKKSADGKMLKVEMQ